MKIINWLGGEPLEEGKKNFVGKEPNGREFFLVGDEFRRNLMLKR